MGTRKKPTQAQIKKKNGKGLTITSTKKTATKKMKGEIAAPNSNEVISLDKIKEHVKNNRETWEEKLGSLEKRLVGRRDEGKLPIHLTKWRIKSFDSIFTKVKRYSLTDLKKISDYAGFRVLCLFDEDIIKVHNYLLQILNQGGYTIENLNLFNWDPEHKSTKSMHAAAMKLYPNLPQPRYEPRRKESGYKSVHYTCSFNEGPENYFLEIQLRTVLQDAWAELEHSLSYKKGRVHPYIRKNFDLLAKDLATSDELMNYLRRLSTGYQQMETYSMANAGPHQYFDYDDSMTSDMFKTGQQKTAFKKYLEFVQKQNPKECEIWMGEASKLYSVLKSKVKADELSKREVRYFILMEQAFLDFCAGSSQKALDIYSDLLRDEHKEEYKKRGVLFFRMGEANFIQGDIVKALERFDQSEQLMTPDSTVNRINAFRVKTKLANIYWILGPEYSEIAHRQIMEAKTICDEEPNLFSPEDRLHLVNNVCWYSLEKFLSSGEDKDYIAAREAFDNLKTQVGTGSNISSNQYDTLAWCSYQFYLKEGKTRDLDHAKKWCPNILQAPNRATFRLTSWNLQMQHIQQILSTE
jgi:ppGpp synthetase/RelA/SpoT-type nucleotidyltranferase